MQVAKQVRPQPEFDPKEYADYLDETVGIDENAGNVREIFVTRYDRSVRSPTTARYEATE